MSPQQTLEAVGDGNIDAARDAVIAGAGADANSSETLPVYLKATLTLLLLAIALNVMVLIQSFADGPIRPDPAMTPGAVETTDKTQVCVPDDSRTVRRASSKLRAAIYAKYGIDWRPGHYEIDHLIPLSIGGADVEENLWPQSYKTPYWNAEVKNRLELKLHELVCHDELGIRQAQEAISRDWISAYKRFCPTESACPGSTQDGRKL